MAPSRMHSKIISDIRTHSTTYMNQPHGVIFTNGYVCSISIPFLLYANWRHCKPLSRAYLTTHIQRIPRTLYDSHNYFLFHKTTIQPPPGCPLFNSSIIILATITAMQYLSQVLSPDYHPHRNRNHQNYVNHLQYPTLPVHNDPRLSAHILRLICWFCEYFQFFLFTRNATSTFLHTLGPHIRTIPAHNPLDPLQLNSVNPLHDTLNPFTPYLPITIYLTMTLLITITIMDRMHEPWSRIWSTTNSQVLGS